MKRKKVITLFAFLLVVVILFIVYKYFSSAIVKPPERSANIPKQSVWVGGADGGNWYQITKVISKNTNGYPQLGARFIPSS